MTDSEKNDTTPSVLPQDSVEKTKDDWGVTGTSSETSSGETSSPSPHPKDGTKSVSEASGCNQFGSFIGVIISIFVSGVIFVVINYYYESIPFLTDSFQSWIPYANLSILVSVIIQIVQFLWNNKTVKPLLEVVTNVFALIAGVKLLVIYPFDFNVLDWNIPVEQIVRILLILAIIGISIGIIVGFVTFFSRLHKSRQVEE